MKIKLSNKYIFINSTMKNAPGKVVWSFNVLSKFICRSYKLRFGRKVTFFRIDA